MFEALELDRQKAELAKRLEANRPADSATDTRSHAEREAHLRKWNEQKQAEEQRLNAEGIARDNARREKQIADQKERAARIAREAQQEAEHQAAQRQYANSPEREAEERKRNEDLACTSRMCPLCRMQVLLVDGKLPFSHFYEARNEFFQVEKRTCYPFGIGNDMLSGSELLRMTK